MARQIDLSKCESPIETRMALILNRELREGVEIVLQAKLKGLQNYRADIGLKFGGEKAIIECDGKSFHDFVEDQARDIDILLHTDVSYIVRFPGKDINFTPDAVVSLLRSVLPDLFEAGKPRPTLKELIDISRLSNCGLDGPVYRAKVSLDALGEELGYVKPKDIPAYAFVTIHRTDDEAIIQLLGPSYSKWNRCALPLGDTFTELLLEMGKR